VATILVPARVPHDPLTDVRPVILGIGDASRGPPHGCRAADIPLTESVVKTKVAALPGLALMRRGDPRLPDHDLAVASLRRCALFAHVDDDGLRVLAALMRPRRFRRNEVIFHQEDVGDALHIVVDGGVKIVLPSQEGEEAIIASLKPGDFFGELALLDGSPRSTTATALEPTETMALPRDQFLRLLPGDPRLVTALLRALAGELRRLTGHVEELHFLDLAGRLTMRLVRLARDVDPKAVGRVELDWPFTQSDLAAMIGGTRQSVNKLLSGLVDEGLLKIDRDTLVITDLATLEARSAR
jgi:CRP/FNR family cyclic AMP-dependent transcriptional regulator